jgi:hypothetical protein
MFVPPSPEPHKQQALLVSLPEPDKMINTYGWLTGLQRAKDRTKLEQRAKKERYPVEQQLPLPLSCSVDV